MEAMGHAFVSMALGMGWQKMSYITRNTQDIVNTAIFVASLSALIAVFSGLLAIPMVEQMSEAAFGANWIFVILPRWLMYGSSGDYYCVLFLLALFYVSFFLSTQAQYLFSTMAPRRKAYKLAALFLVSNIFISWFLILFFYQDNWWAMWRQHQVLRVDRLFVDFILPINALLTTGFLFIFSNRKQRKTCLLDQRVLYNENVFFRYWQISCLCVLPAVWGLGWLLLFFKYIGMSS